MSGADRGTQGTGGGSSPEAIETLLEALRRSADPRTLARVQELVRALLDLHAAGLARVVELAHEKDGEIVGGRTLVDALVADPPVAALLLLHGLHPVPIADRAREALEKVAPAGWQVDLEAHDARLRVSMKRVGDPRRAAEGARARSLVVLALEQAAPDAEEVEIVGDLDDDAGSDFVPLRRLTASAAASGGPR
jgi:hypothetical protein